MRVKKLIVVCERCTIKNLKGTFRFIEEPYVYIYTNRGVSVDYFSDEDYADNEYPYVT